MEKIEKLIKQLKINHIKFIIFLFIFSQNIPLSYCDYNIVVFDSHEYRAGHFAFNSNGDMIIEYSKDYYRLFYGLKKNGKYYFSNDTSTKEISIGNVIEGAKRYESKNIFVSVGNQQYLFSIGSSKSITELHNLDSGQYLFKSTDDFLGGQIYSYIFTILEIINNDKKEYIIAYINDRKYKLKKFYFTEYSLNLTLASLSEEYSIAYDNRIVSSFIMYSKIIVFFVNWEKKYEISVYDFNLNKLNTEPIILDSISDFNEGFGIFSKSYHIKDNLAFFIYFKSPTSKNIKVKIGNINNDYTFTKKLSRDITEYKFQYDVLLNDCVKVNEERFIYIGLAESTSEELSILLFDSYNNYDNMKIRLYEVNLNKKYEIQLEFSADIYNNILAFTSTVVNKGSNNQFSILMLFGYANGTDSNIDVSEYFMDDYINSSKNIVSKLIENVIIENNIFGYEIITDKIKLALIPEEILFL